jgi:hypothetical protein
METTWRAPRHVLADAGTSLDGRLGKEMGPIADLSWWEGRMVSAKKPDER